MPEKKPKVVWKRVLLLLAIVLGSLWTIGGMALYVMNQVVVYHARKDFLSVKGLDLLPTPLTTNQLADSKDWKTVQCDNYSIQIPRSSIKKVRNGKDGCTVETDDEFIEITSSAIFPVPAFVKASRTPNSKDAAKLVSIMGKQTLSSSYSLLNTAMYAMPNQDRFFQREKAKARVALLLEIKTSVILMADAVHPISSDKWRGFQTDEYYNGTRDGYRLTLLGLQDQELQLWITPRKRGVLSQAEINAIVGSLQETKPAGCVGTGCS